MSFTAAQISKLNKMNRASQDVSLGTVISGLVDRDDIVTTGSTVTAAQAAASAATIPTGLAAVTYYMVQVFSSGSNITTFNTANSSASIVVSGSATYKMATGDKINVLAW